MSKRCVMHPGLFNPLVSFQKGAEASPDEQAHSQSE